jgi:hypothetical protein
VPTLGTLLSCLRDVTHVAFLDRWPTVPGKVLVAPKAHIEHVVRGEREVMRRAIFVRS